MTSDRDEPRTVTDEDWMPTDEEIRDQVTWEFSGEKEATARAAFDRWLARVKRAAKMEALEEAAEMERGADPWGVNSVPSDWLRARAAEIREETK